MHLLRSKTPSLLLGAALRGAITKKNTTGLNFSSNAAPSKSRKSLFLTLVLGGSAAAGGYYLWESGKIHPLLPPSCRQIDYQKVYNTIASTLPSSDYDDGSYAPVYVRLAWHCSGTYDKSTNTGGSSKATMRFPPESSHGGNAGLHIARERLEFVKSKYPLVSYGDLWTLAGTCAIQEMGGPLIPWRPGRVDGSPSDCTPDGRLPDGGNPDPQHPRDVFYRMGFNDQEIVALIGAHALGRCHEDRSGFSGPWTASPTSFTNFFFIELTNRKWIEKKWSGPKQYIDKESGELMMLPADMAFLRDPKFKVWVEKYAKDEKLFFEDFTAAWIKLIELGVEFPKDSVTYTFTPTE